MIESVRDVIEHRAESAAWLSMYQLSASFIRDRAYLEVAGQIRDQLWVAIGSQIRDEAWAYAWGQYD